MVISFKALSYACAIILPLLWALGDGLLPNGSVFNYAQSGMMGLIFRLGCYSISATGVTLSILAWRQPIDEVDCDITVKNGGCIGNLFLIVVFGFGGAVAFGELLYWTR